MKFVVSRDDIPLTLHWLKRLRFGLKSRSVKRTNFMKLPAIVTYYNVYIMHI